MPAFPTSPVSPAELLEQWLPAAFAEAALPEELRALDYALGVELTGDGGGEWVVQMVEGVVQVNAAPRGDTSFTYVQSVADWRGALWEGQGGAFGKGAGALFDPQKMAAGTAKAVESGLPAVPSPAALEGLRVLDGLIQLVVTEEASAWNIGLRLGPGAIPAEPTTTVSISAADAAQMESGELNPLEAFMAGRIQVAGDMTLMMQMQAVIMQAAAEAQAKAG
jgi:hypothetical protein